MWRICEYVKIFVGSVVGRVVLDIVFVILLCEMEFGFLGRLDSGREIIGRLL